MDEQALSELLECSVCLERLNHTSKVLPCQHTFCRRCLEEIVSTQQELRCPECRTLVTTRVEDLPPNILLVRLLEGLKTQGHVLSAKPASYQRKRDTSLEGRQHQASRPGWDSPQPCARALYSYEASEKDDLTFKKGDMVMLRRQIDDNWYQGELNGQIGVFPASYVQVLVPLPQIPQCRALYDFQLDDENEKDCLTFKKDEVITVIRRVDTNWIEGRKSDKIGILPLAFVELNHAAKTLISSKPPSLSMFHGQSTGSNRTNNATSTTTTTTSSTSNSTTVTTTSTTTTSTTQPPRSPASMAWHGSRVSQQKRHSFTPESDSPSPPPQSQRHSLELSGGGGGSGGGGSSSNIATSSASSSSALSSSTAMPAVMSASMPASMAVSSGLKDRAVPIPPKSSVSGASNGAPTESTSSKANSGNSSGSAASSSGAVSLTGLNTPVYIAMYNYRPQKDDEVELRKGDYYTVTEKCQDGWFKGQCLRTGISGVFPGNYVQLIRTPSAFKPVNPNVLNIRAKAPSPHNHHRDHHSSSRSHADSDSNSASPPIPPHIKTSSSTAPPLLPRVARMSPSSSPSSVTGRHSPHTSSHSSKSISNTHVPVTITGGKGLHSSSGASLSSVMRSMSAPGGSPSDSSHRGGGSGSGASGHISRASSSSSSNSRLCVMTGGSESHRRTSSPHGALLSVQHSMSTSSNITPPNVVMGPAESSSSQLAFIAKDRDKRERREKEKKGLVKLLAGKSKKSKSSSSCESAPSHLTADSVAHMRSGSYPSERSSPGSPREISQHRKTASLDSSTSPSSKTRSKPQIRERYRCIVPYPPQTEHELELELGDIVHVHKRREDGWYKGTQERTSKTGLFPGSFVEKCD